MKLPEQLLNAMDSAREALATSDDGNLYLGRRQQIWAALGPVEKRKGFSIRASDGLRRRARLAMSCAELVEPFWDDYWSGYVYIEEDDVHKQGPEWTDCVRWILEQAQAYLDGHIRRDRLRKDYKEVIWYADALVTETENRCPQVYVATTAGLAAYTAAMDEDFDPSSIAPNLSDRDIDSDYLDAGFFAVRVYAECASTPSTVEERWREFWRIYVDELTPSAYRAVP